MQPGQSKIKMQITTASLMKYEAKNYHKTQGIGTYNTQQDHIWKKNLTGVGKPFSDIHDQVFEKINCPFQMEMKK